MDVSNRKLHNPPFIPILQMKKQLLAATLAFSLNGCSALTWHEEQARNYQGPRSLPQEVQQRFNYTSPLFSQTQLQERENRLFYTRETRTLTTLDEHLGRETTITFEYYKTKLQNNPPLVLVSPILGADYPFERPMCEHLAENGISAVLVHRPKRMLKIGTCPSPETMLRSITTDRRKAVDA